MKPSIPFWDAFLKKAKESIDPEQIMLFGSRARGDHHEKSDYDFAFVGSKVDQWTSFCLWVQEKLPTLHKLDLVQFEKVDKKFQDHILSEGVVLYER